MKFSPRIWALVTGITCASALSISGRNIDLNRIDPVPANEPIPIQDFFRPRVLQEPSLNLAGTHIAAIITAGVDRHELLVYELKTQKIERISGIGDMDVYRFTWLGDSRVLFSLSGRKLYGLGLFAGDVGNVSNSYPVLQYYGSRLVSVPYKNPQFPLIWNASDMETGRDRGVASINTNIKTGRFVNLLRADARRDDALDARDMNERVFVNQYPLPDKGIVYGYAGDKEGELAYAFTSDNGTLNLLRLAGDRWEKCPIDLEQVGVLGPGNVPGQIAVIGAWADSKPRPLQLVNATTGAVDEVLLQDAGYDFNGWLYRDPVSHLIVGAVLERNGPKVIWFDEGYAKLQSLLDGFFPKMVVRILGSDRTGKIFLVSVRSDRQPVIYNWVNLDNRQVGLIKKSAPWIDPERMQPMNIVKFKIRDGRKLDAYVTMPKGATKANPPPLVVLPHGGPWVRDEWQFDGEVQFLASRGYAVMQPNYRGSTGYDWMFPYEDRWAFRKMSDDVTDATKAMIASGLIDPKRIAIMGGSFGGYLAVSGVEHEPGLYRCAVTIAGVFDWAAHVRERKYDRFDDPDYDRLIKKLGDPSKEPEKFAAISILSGASHIAVPVFVSHGKDDPIVEIAQSRHLISELEKGHVPHESLLVSEEGHGMGHLDNEVELYTRIEAFLAKNLAAVP